jgi:hypothetical protein
MAKTAAVLGAGIQGCCAALALSKLGFKVKLYDKNRALFNRASANQEAKVHLGFVYARDQSMTTARKMIEHAMQFAPALESLIGPIDWEPHLSRRFFCGVHKNSSLTLDQHVAHFNALQSIYEEVADDTRLHYLGRRPKRIWDDTELRFDGNSIIHGVMTQETAVHPGWMRDVIVNAVRCDHQIKAFTEHRIDHVDRTGRGFKVFGVDHTGTWNSSADVVINCLWEGKHRIDETLGLNHDPEWITRVKYGFVLQSKRELDHRPSLIVTHGPFGDIVNYPYDNTIYITWYPACMTYIGHTEELPGQWESVCEGHHPPDLVQAILGESIRKLAEYMPELTQLTLKQVMAGSIMGRGNTDITDRNSGLHKRHGIGVDVEDGYYSIFTGKYTSGPANAIELQQLLD